MTYAVPLPIFPAAPMVHETGALAPRSSHPGPAQKVLVMKVVHSLKTAKTRHKDCRVVRRRGRVSVINKRNPRFKAPQA